MRDNIAMSLHRRGRRYGEDNRREIRCKTWSWMDEKCTSISIAAEISFLAWLNWKIVGQLTLKIYEFWSAVLLRSKSSRSSTMR